MAFFFGNDNTTLTACLCALYDVRENANVCCILKRIVNVLPRSVIKHLVELSTREALGGMTMKRDGTKMPCSFLGAFLRAIRNSKYVTAKELDEIGLGVPIWKRQQQQDDDDCM